MRTQVVLGIPPQTSPTWFPLEKPKEKKKQGAADICLGNQARCRRPAWNTRRFCWPWAGMPDQRAGGNVIRQEKQHRRNSTAGTSTPTAHILTSPPPPRGGGKCAPPHREEKPARVDLIPANTEQTPMQGQGQSAALRTERKPHPLNHRASSHHVPSIYLIMNIFIVFHCNHLSVKVYFANGFPHSSGWHLSFPRLKQTQGDILTNLASPKTAEWKMVGPSILMPGAF